MTTDNKTLAVDVLAVWAEMADSIANRRDECLGRRQFIQAEIYRGMLAKHSRSMIAVAELIDVASRFDSYKSSDFGDTSILDNEDLWNRLSAALARVKGESA